MDVSCLELKQDGTLVERELSDGRARWRAKEGAFWLDVRAYTVADLEALLDDLAVGAFAKQRCLEAGSGGTVIALADGTFGEWPVFADKARKRRTQVAVLCLPGLLLTMHPHPIETARDVQDSGDLLAIEHHTTSSLLTSLVFRQSSIVGSAVRELRERVMKLGRRMDAAIGAVDADEIDELKRAVSLCDAIAEEQAEAFSLLRQAQSVGFDAAAMANPLKLVTTRANATARMVDRVDRRAESLVQRFGGAKQELLNKRLGVLTILSAIFLPLTLLAGIWGMNFENMPELDDPWAYPTALGVMGATAALMLFFFYKRGWFD